MMNTKVLIIEDEAIIARDLQMMIEKEGFRVVAIVRTLEEVVTVFRTHQPDLILSDVYLNDDISGLDIVRELLSIRSVPVIFNTAYSNDELISRVSNLQNVFYLTKPYTSSQVLATLKIAVNKIPPDGLPRVSHREKQIVDLLVRGRSSCEIAADLNISVETVKTHRKHIFSKFGVNSATQLVSKILQYGGSY